MRPLLEVRGLTKTYPVYRGLLPRVHREVKVLDGVSLSIDPGEIFAVVGESGGGKTTLARCVLRLTEPSDGQIVFDGTDLLSLSQTELRRHRRDFQMVFQDPSSSLNPRLSVGQTLCEPLEIHQLVPARQRQDHVARLLQKVGLPKDAAVRYPHEFSGGQRQRVAIARALAAQPRFLVADEPVSALDMSVRAEILNLLSTQCREETLAILLIAHDLAMVERISQRVAVLYLGQIVELAPTRDLFREAKHPYTVTLMASAPTADPTRRRSRIAHSGELSSTIDPPKGCRFHPRCPIANDRCRAEEPALTEVAEGHLAACHLPGELAVESIERVDHGTF
jgi:oligopeptide transport system ATP-binding protein